MSNVNVHVQRDLAHPAQRVWGILGDFGNMSWTVGTERVEIIGEGPGMIRRLYMPGLSEPIDEVLESIEPAARSYSYTIPRGLPMPISNYLAKVRLEELPSGGCRVHWSATGDAVGVSGDEAAAILDGAYAQLLGWLEDALAKG
jgi:hypothetical protein